jgi:GPH family glycoside/pentoside/hexuronide:cation symporter
MKLLLKRTKKTSPIGFAMGLFGLTLITQLFHAYNLSYYTDSGMVNMFYATICKIVFVIVDWLDDLLFGAMSEKTKSRFGKRLPWLIWGAVWLPISVILTYVVNTQSNFSMFGFFIYYLVISISVELISTVLYINYNALYPTLFSTTSSRSKTSTYKHIFEILAMGVCYICTPILTHDLGLNYAMVGVIYGSVYLIAFAISIGSMKIKDDILSASYNDDKYSLKAALKDSFHNKPFILYNIAQSFFAAILAVVVSLYPMYCKYVLTVAGWQESIVFACFFFSLLISIPFWYFLIKKIGFIKVWLISFSILPVSLLMLLFPSSFVTGVVVCSIIGPSFGGLMLTPDMLFAELIDIDKIEHHVSREAILGSIGSLIGRASIIIAAIVTALLTLAFGYNSGSDPGPNPELAFRVSFGAVLPIVALTGTVFAFIYVKKSAKSRMLLHELKRMSVDETTEINISEVINATRKK